jgi:hypothetical protein
MHKTALLRSAAAIASILLISACSGSEQSPAPAPTEPSADAAMAEEAPANAAVTLPPSLLASRTFRCKDNSLVYVDFFSDNVSADLRTDKSAPATKLTAPAAGEAYTGGGFTVSGSGEQVNITQPGKDSQSCKA